MSKTSFVLPSTTKDRDNIKNAIKEICNHFTFMDGYNEKVKEVCAMLKEEYNMPAPTSRKLGKFMMLQNFQDTADKFETLEELYEVIVKPTVK